MFGLFKTPQLHNFTPREGGFVVGFPKSPVAVESSLTGVRRYTAQTAQAVYRVTVEQAGGDYNTDKDIMNYLLRQELGIASMLPDSKRLAFVQNKMLGEPSPCSTYEVTEGGGKYFMHIRLVLKKGTLYTFLLSLPTQPNDDLFNDFIESFKLIEN